MQSTTSGVEQILVAEPPGIHLTVVEVQQLVGGWDRTVQQHVFTDVLCEALSELLTMSLLPVASFLRVNLFATKKARQV